MDWAELFPATDYEFVLRVRRRDPAPFFLPHDPSGAVLAERGRWLDTAAEHHLVAPDSAAPLVHEFLRLLTEWQLLAPTELDPSQPAATLLAAAGRRLEPDVILLQRDGGACRLAAGCVCFPSSWSLAEKKDLSVDQIHAIVPGLNRTIGRSIDQFLARLAPGLAWCRANWGLSRSGELNQDPWRQLPRLTKGIDPSTIWLRVEHQALVALPQSNGVLFAIRVETMPIRELADNPIARHGLHRALVSMPEEMVRYKGLTPVRDDLGAWLRALEGRG